MSKARHILLLEKSKSAALSAIELYNKPNFSYREESFSILIVNAWELLLKAKRLKENRNKLTSIYVPYNPKKKDGNYSKKIQYKPNRAGNPMTVSIIDLIKTEITDENLRENLETLVEVRDNSIHLMNESKIFEKIFLEASLASLKNYSYAMNEWFGISLNDIDLMLIPLAFNAPKAFDIEALKKETKEHNKLLAYMQKKKSHPKEESEYAVSIIVDVKLEKNKKGDISISYDKNGTPIYYESEEEFKRKYPLTYDDLKSKIKTRYTDLKMNKTFNDIMRELKKDEKLHKMRFLNIGSQTGPKKPFYSPNILKELDKHYTRKEQS